MVYKHAYLKILLLLHSEFMVCVLVKLPLKGKVGGSALNSHGNYMLIKDNHGKIMEL